MEHTEKLPAKLAKIVAMPDGKSKSDAAFLYACKCRPHSYYWNIANEIFHANFGPSDNTVYPEPEWYSNGDIR